MPETKATFSLHSDVLAALDEAMARERRQQNALVERALAKELKSCSRPGWPMASSGQGPSAAQRRKRDRDSFQVG